jgi:ectoine hydroxylase-related dioxygenase (phytanoyl-CoA dioxygenase family)
MVATETTTFQPPRQVRPDEAEHFQRNGWVRLEQLISAETAGALLDRLQSQMGQRAVKDVGTAQAGLHARSDYQVRQFNQFEDPSASDSVIATFAYSREFAAVSADLLGVKAVRFWRDEALCKLPASQGGGATPWHQDWASLPYDRTGKTVIWIALVDIPPERGSMQFLSGSHLYKPLGYSLFEPGQDLLDVHPELVDLFEVSPPLHLRAGDATVHESLTIHYAPANTTEEPRWVYYVSHIDGKIHYTGAPNRLADRYELEPRKPFDHPRFPLTTFD